MKYFLSIMLMVFISPAWAINIVGDDAYPPYSSKEDGRVTGIYVDIIQYALTEMDDTSSITAMPWKRGLRELKTNNIDVLFPPYYRPKHRPYMSYSTDIINETLVIVCNAKLAKQLTHFPEDYKGIKLGKNLGFSMGEAVEEAVKENIVMLHEAKGMAANLKKLINNRINCYVNDRLSILFELKRMAGRGEYDGKSIVETHILSLEKGYLAINKDASSEVKIFIDRFNSVIEGMKLSGKIDEIISKYTQ